MFRDFFSALLPCRGWHVPRRRQPSPVPHTSLISSSTCCVQSPQLLTRHSSRYYRLSCVSFWWPMQGVLLGADEGCTFGSRCRLSVRRNMLGVLPGIYAGCHFGVSSGCPFGSRCGGLRPGADVIDLHEIHLARQSSLQVPVGHIPVPGGIKLCLPGTFWVANCLIINNGSCQVNFTKPKRATIRYTTSQSLREDATEASVGRVAVPKCR